MMAGKNTHPTPLSLGWIARPSAGRGCWSLSKSNCRIEVIGSRVYCVWGPSATTIECGTAEAATGRAIELALQLGPQVV